MAKIRPFTASQLDNLRTGLYKELMRVARLLGVLIIVSSATACDRSSQKTDPSSTTTRARSSTAPKPTDLAYVCPMDREIRSNEPGKCSR